MSGIERIHGDERLIVVVGPSGAGKDALLRAWRTRPAAMTGVHFARRTITRDAHGESEAHEPLPWAQFEGERDRGAFALHWQAHGLHYGIRWSEVAPLAAGRWVVMNGSREHLPLLRSTAPGARVIAVEASAALRRARLDGRAREAGATVDERLQRSLPTPHSDLTIVNDGSLDEAVARFDAWWRGVQALEPSKSSASNP